MNVTPALIVFFCAVITTVVSVVTFFHLFIISEEQDKMLHRFNQLEESIREQLDLSRRTLDASNRMVREALRLAEQNRHHGNTSEEDFTDNED